MLARAYNGPFNTLWATSSSLFTLCACLFIGCFVEVDEPICFTDGRTLTASDELSLNLCCTDNRSCKNQLDLYCQNASDELCELSPIFALSTCQDKRCVLCSLNESCQSCRTHKDCASVGENATCEIECVNDRCFSQCVGSD